MHSWRLGRDACRKRGFEESILMKDIRVVLMFRSGKLWVSWYSCASVLDDTERSQKVSYPGVACTAHRQQEPDAAADPLDSLTRLDQWQCLLSLLFAALRNTAPFMLDRHSQQRSFGRRPWPRFCQCPIKRWRAHIPNPQTSPFPHSNTSRRFIQNSQISKPLTTTTTHTTCRLKMIWP